MKKKMIVPLAECSRGYRQWFRCSKELPEFGKVVRGIFANGREMLCEYSPEEGIWSIDMFITDPPILWSYPY